MSRPAYHPHRPGAWRAGRALARLVVGGVLPALVLAPAAAQQPPAAVQPLPLETIVITGKAGWQAERALGSAIVLDGTQWRTLGEPDFSTALSVLPGVQPNRSGSGQSLPTLRGIGTVTSGVLLGTQQATTGLYLDDLPLTDAFGFLGTPDFTGFELSRIQVLRGPQGVLYGSASLGGAIDVGLALPRLGQSGQAARTQLSWREDGRPALSLRAALTGSPRPEQTWRLEAFGRHDGGLVDNEGTGRVDADRLQRHGVRLAGLWQPHAHSQARVHLLHQRSRADDGSAVWPGLTRRTSTPSASTRDDRLSLARVDLATELDADTALDFTVGWVDKTARRANDLTRSTGAIGTLVGASLGVGALPDLPLITSVTDAPTRSRALTHELRLSSVRPDGVRWLVGAFGQVTRFDNDSRSLAPGGAALWGPFGALLPGDEVGALRIAARSSESAVFGEASLPLAPAWRASAGARAYRAGVRYDATVRFLGRDSRGAPSTVDRGLMPRLALQYEAAGYGAYALLSRGFRVGGVNFNPPVFTPYRSDRLLNHELGVRLDLTPGARAELALFTMDWRDAQVSALTTQPLPLIGVANVGRARSRGVEAALTAALPSHGQARLRIAGIDAVTRAPFTTAAGVPVTAGARLPGTPRWQAVADVTQPLALPAGWAGVASADMSARSRRVDAIGSPATSAGRAIVGFGLTATRRAWQWQLRLDNAGNTVDVAGAEVVDRQGLPPLTDRYLAEPRRISLALRHEL